MTIQTSADIKDIAAALLAFQSQATGVVKDSKNPHFKNRYASLEAVIDEARPKLQAVGIAWMQAPGRINAGNIEMTTMLLHAASGQWMSSTMEIPLGKHDPQGAGSAITYASRYALMSTLGLPPVDDDAESAMPRNYPSAPMTGRTAPAAPPLRTPAAGAPLSAAYAAFHATMKISRSKAELREWFFANKDAIADNLSGDESKRLIEERNNLATRLPEFVEVAA